MPTSISMRTPGALNTTRQQLDELDTLLKRMLALPVNKLDVVDEAEVEVSEDAVAEPPPAPIAQPMAMEPIAPTLSYMVVETASPQPLPLASDIEPQPLPLAPETPPASGFEPRPVPLKPATPPASGFELRPSPLTPVTPVTPVTPPEIVVKELEPVVVPSVEHALRECAPTQEVSVPQEPPMSEPEAWVPLRSTWQPSAQTWQPLAESWRQANSAPAMPAVVPGPTPNPHLDPAPSVPEPVETKAVEQAAPSFEFQALSAESQNSELKTQDSELEKAEPPLSLTMEDAPEEPSSLLLPLLWFNQGFDACVAPLGAAGRWICGPSGRQMLGIAGLACLAAAAVVAVSTGMAWTW